MPFNGAGTWTRLYNWVNDATNAINIRADRMDAEMNDMAAGLSNAITRDGQGKPTATIDFNGQNLINVGTVQATTLTGTTGGVGTFNGRTGVVALTGTDVSTAGGALTSTLGTSAGGSLVNTIASGTGAVSRAVQDILRESVSVKGFGAVGDGVTDDTAAFTAAMASLGAKGGMVRYFDKHLIDANLTIPANVTLLGPMWLVGSPGTNPTAPYGNMAALILNSAATITLSSGAGHVGGLVYRKGMTFPAANSSAFAGTAFTVNGDDAFLLNSMVLGFNKGFFSNNFQRPKVQNVNIDCVNGVEINACYDITKVSVVHCWPFATIAQYALDTTMKTVIQRSGTAFRFANIGDWNKVTDCFAYGYYRGFVASSADSLTFTSCSADSTMGFVGQIGFIADGTSRDTRFVNCQAAAQETGYYINTTGGHTHMVGCDSWACASQAVLINSGDVSILGGILRNTIYGITQASTTSRLMYSGVRFEGLNAYPVNIGVVNNRTVEGVNDYGDLPVTVPGIFGGVLQIVPSADPLPIPNSGTEFNVSGTVNIGSMNGGRAGRRVTLMFGGALTVFTGGASPTGFKLSGGANFTSVAGSNLTLLHDGSFWQEIGRKV